MRPRTLQGPGELKEAWLSLLGHPDALFPRRPSGRPRGRWQAGRFSGSAAVDDVSVGFAGGAGTALGKQPMWRSFCSRDVARLPQFRPFMG